MTLSARNQSVRRVAFLLFTCAAIIACQQTPAVYLKAAPPVQLEPGWRNLKSQACGFTIAVPAGWDQMENVPSFKQTSIPSFGLSTSSLMQAMEEKPEVKEGMTIVGASDGGFAILEIERLRYSHNQSANGICDEMRHAMNANPMVDKVDEEKVDLPIGTASRVKASITKLGNISGAITSYYLIDGHDVYRATFTGFNEEGSKVPTKQIMRTFRLLSPSNKRSG